MTLDGRVELAQSFPLIGLPAEYITGFLVSGCCSVVPMAGENVVRAPRGTDTATFHSRLVEPVPEPATGWLLGGIMVPVV